MLPATTPKRLWRDTREVHERPHRFLAVNPFLVPGTRQARSIRPPTRLTLEGPSSEGLRVIFHAADGSPLTDVRLQAGIDFHCEGEWIADPREQVTRAKPRRYYARDAEGRLIGHEGYARFGLTLLFGVFPTPVHVDDRAWWRLEAAPPAR